MAEKYGPSGGTGGGPYDIQPPIETNTTLDTTPWVISSIEFKSGAHLDSITVAYRNIATQEIRFTPVVGGSGGGPNPPLTMEKGVHIWHFKGFFWQYVDQLTIEYGKDNPGLSYTTNWNSIGDAATDFDYEVESGKEVIGFWGRGGLYIDSIGVHVRKTIE
ncbi:jacalin-like lectin [Streptomyces acidicola]|uniref:jacalin-like lectin n=1 Tax=Streptomyces acidicola TaxID=2596892 RepID=UPI0037B8D0A3